MKYPILYESNATDFFALGLGPLSNTLSARVIEERNGSFYLEAEILVDSPIFPLVLNDCLIKADAGHLLKNQRFRIKRIVPKHDGTAEIYAEHVSYLAEELTLKPEVSVNGNAGGALSTWKGAIVESNPFVVDSDISTSNSTKWRIDKVENPRMALGGVGGSILDVWGGEYRFDNYHISLLQKRGTTANTVLAYGRNITDFEQENNIANTYTSIVPYAIYTDDNENEITVTVDGYTVHSQYAGNYPNTRSLPVNFSDEFNHNEVPTKAKLTQMAEQYIIANEVGVPKTSIKVSFLDLSKSPDYAEYQHLEELNLCDDVRVHYPKLGVDTTAKVIRTVWNVLTESYDEIEIGEKRMTLSSKINEQTKQIKEINNQTNYAITSADGKNTIFVGLYGEDGLGEPTATKIGDSWWKPDGQFTELYIWDGTIWEFIMSTKENHEIQVKIEELETQTTEMIEDIDDAVAKAEEARLAANFATDAVEVAVTQSADAVTQAQQAKVDAISALEAYQNLEIGGRNLLRNSAFSDGTQNWVVASGGGAVLVDSSNKFEGVDSLKVTFNEGGGPSGVNYRVFQYNSIGIQSIDMISSVYVKADSEVVVGLRNGDAIVERFHVGSDWVRISQVAFGNKILLFPDRPCTIWIAKPQTNKGNQLLDWTPAPEDVQTQITSINGELSQKVSQNTFNILEGTVSTQGTQINQNKADILLRATKTEVNTLTGTVSSLDSQLNLEAGKISALNTKTDGHTTQIGSLQSSYDGLQSTVSSVQTDLSNLDLTDRNLLPKSDFATADSISGWIADGVTREWNNGKTLRIVFTKTTSFNRVYVSKNILADLKTGEKYSVSFKAFSNYNSGIKIGGWGNLSESITIDTRDMGKVYTVEGLVKGVSNTFSIVGDNSNPDFIVQITDIMVVKGNKARPHQLAPEDLTTVQAFSDFQQTVQGFQTTVNSSITGLESQQTQMAGQIQSVVTETRDVINLFKDPKFATSASTGVMEGGSWSTNNSTGAGRVWTNNTGSTNRFYFNASNTVLLERDKEYSIKAKVNTGPGIFRIGIMNGYMYDITPNVPAEWITFTLRASPNIALSVQVSDGGSIRISELYVYESSSGITSSQITQLSDQIDLRVTKADLISQINVQAGKVLIRANDNVLMVTPTTTYIQNATIKTAHIADLAVSGAKIANATISSAKIISLDASKITANTLSAITTNTGSLNVSGWLTMSSPNIGLLGSYDFGDDDTGAFNPRYFVGDYRFSHRYLFFSAQVYNVSNGVKGTYKYHTESFYGPDYLKLRQYTNSSKSSLSNRIDITADKLQIANDWGTTSGVILNADGTSKFGGFAEFSNGLHVGVTSEGVGVRTGRISAPANYNTFKINENRALADVTFSTENVNFNETRTVAADFRIGKDGSAINGGRVVASMAIYNRTYSSAANMIVTPDGVLGRSTSALKYKDDVRTADDVINKAKKVIQLQPKSWLDKGELADGVANKRHYGFIADEFDVLGLPEVVIYGDTGQVESLAYDRISMYHNVILKDHEEQLQQLTTVANSRLQETLLLESRLLSLQETVEQLQQEIEQLRTA